MMDNLLIEIGTEELPSSYMQVLEKQLQSAFETWLKEESWLFKSCIVSLTPRRMVFFVQSLSACQQKPEEWIKGPPVQVAFSKDKQETPALQGFLKRCRSSQYEIRTLENGQYVFGLQIPDNQTVQDFFQHHFPAFIIRFPYEKQMRWECYQFIRPIKWVTGFYGSQALSIEILDTTSTTSTRLLQGQGEIPVTSLEEYFSLLKKNHILLSIQERIDAIRKDLSSVYPESVLLENACRTEVPVVVEATFPEKFTSLPKEVLETVILYQLKCFPVYSHDHHSLTNRFYFVMNGHRDTETVKNGFEKVMTARLSDALYFFTQDQQIPFKLRESKLSKVLFMEKLGSMDQKIQRLKYTAEKMNLHTSIPGLMKVISFYKLDVTTLLVQELTELEGVVGKLYAQYSGLEEEYAQAILESYMPKFDQDALPATPLGRWISLLDRWDTWIGIHIIQLSLSSSGDPLGIKRTVNGLLRILKEFPIEFPFNEFIKVSFEAFRKVNGFEFQDNLVFSSWENYYFQRMKSLFANQFRYDTIQAVLQSIRHPNDAESRIRLIEADLQKESLKILYQSYVRIQKIIQTAFSPGPVESALLQSEAEKNLWVSALDVEKRIHSLPLHAILTELYRLNAPVQRFFEEVMVMTEDMKIRENRLRLLSWILSVMAYFADFSRLVFEGGNES